MVRKRTLRPHIFSYYVPVYILHWDSFEASWGSLTLASVLPASQQVPLADYSPYSGTYKRFIQDFFSYFDPQMTKATYKYGAM